MIQALIFDCFGVLATDMWQEFWASLPADERDTASGLNRAYDGGYLAHKDYVSALKNLTGRLPDEAEARAQNRLHKNHALLGYIEQLHESYKIGLLSNIGTNWVREIFLTPKEQNSFDAMGFSFETGLFKPSELAFLRIAEDLTVAPEACLMIDDALHNCQGARAVGMQAILYRDLNQLRADLEESLSQF